MHKHVLSGLILSFALPALAADAPPAAAPAAPAAPAAAMPDMSKMGPMAFAPKNEKQDKKELDEYWKAHQDIMKKGDLNAMADMIAFPVMMMSDDSKGNLKVSEMSRDQWMGMMKPFMDPAHMKEMKDMKMKGSCVVMSDNLASCEGQTTGTMMGKKGTVNSHSMMVRQDGKWKVKTMTEAGWGDMPTAGTGAGAGSK